MSITAGRTDGDDSVCEFPAFGGAAHDSDARPLGEGAGAVAHRRVHAVRRVRHSGRRRCRPHRSTAIFDDNRNQTTDTRAWIEGRYQGDVAGGNLTARVAVDGYEYDGDMVQQRAPDRVNEDRSQGDVVVGRAHLRARTAPRPHARGRGRGAVGPPQPAGERRPHRRSRARDLRALLLRERHDALLGAVRAGEWQIAPGWDATIGVRHDHYSSFGGVTDPRLALIHRPDRRPDAEAHLRAGVPRPQRLRALLHRRRRVAEGEPRPAAGAHQDHRGAGGMALRAAVARRGRVLLQPDLRPHQHGHRRRPTACSST